MSRYKFLHMSSNICMVALLTVVQTAREEQNVPALSACTRDGLVYNCVGHSIFKLYNVQRGLRLG